MKRHLHNRIAGLEFGQPTAPDAPAMRRSHWEDFHRRLNLAYGDPNEPAPAPGPVPSRVEFEQQFEAAIVRAYGDGQHGGYDERRVAERAANPPTASEPPKAKFATPPKSSGEYGGPDGMWRTKPRRRF